MQRGSLIRVEDASVWRLQWRENGKGRTRTLGPGISRGDAQAELDRIVTAVNGRPSPPRSADTLRDYVEHEYLVHRSRIWKGSTKRTTEQLIDYRILRQLGDRPLTALRRPDLQRHLDALAAEDYSASVVKRVRFQLQAIFKLASGDGLINVNPTLGLVNPRCTRDVDKRVITL